MLIPIDLKWTRAHPPLRPHPGRHRPPFALGARKIPVGLELYSVRNELKEDPTGTVRAVAKMGYEVVEFFAPYYAWTVEQETKDIRKLFIDDLRRQNGMSTHATTRKNFLQ